MSVDVTPLSAPRPPENVGSLGTRFPPGGWLGPGRKTTAAEPAASLLMVPTRPPGSRDVGKSQGLHLPRRGPWAEALAAHASAVPVQMLCVSFLSELK